MRLRRSLKAHAGWWNKLCRDRWPLSCYWTEGGCDVARLRVFRNTWRRLTGLKLIRHWAPAPRRLLARLVSMVVFMFRVRRLFDGNGWIHFLKLHDGVDPLVVAPKQGERERNVFFAVQVETDPP